MDSGDATPPSAAPAVIAVDAAEAERALRALLRQRLLDGTRKTERQGDTVLLPVVDAAAALDVARPYGGRLVEDAPLRPREERRSPRQLVIARLHGILPVDLLQHVPDKWEQHDDVLVMRLPEPLHLHAGLVAGAFAEVFGAKAVLHDAAGVGGELRTMREVEFLHGTDAVATHVENGIRYRFDASRIMFSSGNLHERMRAARLPARGETVVDMFAGIGYFALPLAVHAGARVVHALEKNPESFRWLQENVRLNGVGGVVRPWLGDNREFPHEGIADRVHMGYFPGTQKFLAKGLRLLKPEGGLVHYHDTAGARAWRSELEARVRGVAEATGVPVSIEDARVVKSYSPGMVHAVLDVRVRGGPRLTTGGAGPRDDAR